MTECNDCGGCCDPVALPYTPEQLRAAGPTALGNMADYAFVLDALTRIPYRDGISESSHLRDTTALGLDGEPVMSMTFYRCVHYDRTERRCTNYEDRPPMCRGFPWYDGPPDPSRRLPAACSFNADVGREVEVTLCRR